MISIFGGKGFVLGEYCKQFSDYALVQGRQDYVPDYPTILYGISTVHNYNVFDDAHLDIDTNLSLLINILENAKNTFGTDVVFNFISSWFVYGNVECPAKEDACCNPKGFYSITKRTAEQLLISYCETFGLKWRILRLANVIGVGDKKISRKKNALQYMVSEVAKGHDVDYLYSDEYYRDYIDVRDCAKAIDHVIMDGPENQIFNIGNGVSININNTVFLADYFAGNTSKITLMEVPEFHKQVQVKDMWLDNTKLRNLGYNREHTHEDTIRWLVDYYLNNG